MDIQPATKPKQVEMPPDQATGKKVAKGVAGGAAGIIMGVIIGIVMFIAGLLLTFTIIGAIIGIPLMIAAFVTPFAFGGAMAKHAATAIELTCPYCDNKVSWTKRKKAGVCRVCQKRLIMKGNKLQVVE